jgi:hypothetical protein
VLACGSEVHLRAAPNEGASSSGAGGAAGASAVTSTASAASSGGGEVACPDLDCEYPCPDDNHWLDDAGCPSCACLADLVLSPAPAQRHVSLSASLDEATAERYVFGFYWLYDDPQYRDEELYFGT